MQDEPFGSLSIYVQYCVMRLAKENVKVVLDGQGADELLPAISLPRAVTPECLPVVPLGNRSS